MMSQRSAGACTRCTRANALPDDTSGRLVLVRFLEEFEDTKKTFRN